MAHALSTAREAGILFVCLMALSGCSDLSAKQQRMLTGAAIGTTVGAATIAMTGGCVSCGAAVGGAVGAGAGYAYDYFQDTGNSW